MIFLVVVSTFLILWQRIHHFLALAARNQSKALLSILILYWSLEALFRDIVLIRNSYLKHFYRLFVWGQHVSSCGSWMWQPLYSSYFWRYLNPSLAVKLFLEGIFYLTMKLKFDLSFIRHLDLLFLRRYILWTRWPFIIVYFVKIIAFIVVFRLFAFFWYFIDQPKNYDSTSVVPRAQKLTFGFIKCKSRYRVFIRFVMRFNFPQALDQIKSFFWLMNLLTWS